MTRCANCLMMDTKPGLVLNQDGVCQACLNYEARKEVNWEARWDELGDLCQKHRISKIGSGYYDCLIAVSGGKDSTYQVKIMKEDMGMNPLLVAVGDPFTKTEAGIHNLKNLQETFNCDLITLQLSPDLVRRMVRVAFEEIGSPTWAIDRAIYVFPIRMAVNMDIPFVIYGENVAWEYGGVLDEETPSARDQIKNDVAKDVGMDWWYAQGFDPLELNCLEYPSESRIDMACLDPIYLSYYIPWDGWNNYQTAKKYGFRDLTHEWHREGYIEHYDQIDSVGYLMNVYLKYVKYGFGRATDVVGYWIRSGHIDQDKGMQLIRENDYKLDQRILDDFLNFTGYLNKEFWEIVETHKGN